MTTEFNATDDSSGAKALNITINGETVSQSLSLSMMSSSEATQALVPPSANPTLKTKINVTLASSFPYTLSKSDFTVNATNISNPSYFRQMNVIAADDATKTLTVMFGGAWSGLYQVNVRHNVYGLVNTTG